MLVVHYRAGEAEAPVFLFFFFYYLLIFIFSLILFRFAILFLFLVLLFAVFRPRSPFISSPMSSLTPSNSTTHSTSASNSVTYRVVIKGRVQGVFYRDWTVQNASELGLSGWVRNRRDGSVEALFSGPADKVQEIQRRCRSGPPAAVVTGFEAFPSNEDPGLGFERRQTV